MIRLKFQCLFEPVIVTVEDIAFKNNKISLPLNNDVDLIIKDYFYSHVEIMHYESGMFWKDMLYINNTLAFELINNAPHNVLISHIPSNTFRDFKALNDYVKYLQYWSQSMFVFPMLSKKSIPFPQDLLYFKNNSNRCCDDWELSIFPIISDFGALFRYPIIFKFKDKNFQKKTSITFVL
jgi:hypothetical protein